MRGSNASIRRSWPSKVLVSSLVAWLEGCYLAGSVLSHAVLQEGALANDEFRPDLPRHIIPKRDAYGRSPSRVARCDDQSVGPCWAAFATRTFSHARRPRPHPRNLTTSTGSRRRSGRHHRHADDASGSAAEGSSRARLERFGRVVAARRGTRVNACRTPHSKTRGTCSLELRR